MDYRPKPSNDKIFMNDRLKTNWQEALGLFRDPVSEFNQKD
jgi:hypothetical protein